ncbi:RHS repeat-associated core domain-containing protein [Xenorhabdus cabanillasii]|uniref:RHS repeat-associated core domain-containing protein n=1 Tax=Xenorhabdus cabanillasii TaxID=351673 RepID=UPI002B405C9C|nr:RHS repeat-associated core domain-containing protein [Xenorhabdus sp. Flor]
MGQVGIFQRRDGSQFWYKYDNLDRLIRKKQKNPDNHNITSYEYDYSGRLLSLTPSANPEFAVSYTYDAAGRPTSETTALFGTTQFALDNNGNRVSMILPSRVGGLNVTRIYDTLNRLTEVYQGAETAASPIVHYTYDPAGRRTRAVYGNLQSPLAETTLKYNQASLPTTLTYQWNGSQLDVGYQEMAVFSGDASDIYIYGAGLDEVVADITTRGHNFYFQDTLGSTLALTNAKGEVIEKHGYTAYGVESGSGNDNAAFRFAGRRIDPETGLSYNRARYYSPILGRFLQTDPAGTEGGLNLYAYTGNEPVNLIDPTGQWAEASISTANAIIPGAYNMDIAQRYYSAGNYGMAGFYAAAALGDAALMGASTKLMLGMKTAGELAIQSGKAIIDSPAVQRGAQGIYEFIGVSGKKYVGQSSNIPIRLEQHLRSGQLPAGTPVTTTPVPGGKLQRELAEQRRINELGGIKLPDGTQNLENKVNPIGPKREHLLK